MLRRAGGYMNMEALTLISALCIAAIFFYARYARQSSWHDQEARRLASETRPAVETFFQKNPQARLSVEALTKELDFSLPPYLAIKVTPFKELRSEWQLEIWHPEGQRVYLLSPDGLKDQPR
ncbi:Type II secretion system protein [Desulfarculales bacterium]